MGLFKGLGHVVGSVTLDNSRLRCKVCRSIFVYIVLCHAPIIYVHSTYVGIYRVCIPLGVHDHHVFNDICWEIMDIAC